MSTTSVMRQDFGWEELIGKDAFFHSSVLEDILCARQGPEAAWAESARAAFGCPHPLHSRFTSHAALADLVFRIARLLYEGRAQIQAIMPDSTELDVDQKIQEYRSSTRVVLWDHLSPTQRAEFFRNVFGPVLDRLGLLTDRLRLGNVNLSIFVMNFVEFLKDQNLTAEDAFRASEICSSTASILFTADPAFPARPCERAIRQRTEDLKIVNTRDLPPPPYP